VTDAQPGTAATVAPFDIRADLPTGITVLEASAGTGKTSAIADLATRLVAAGDGTRLRDLLIVTFTRAATGELRDRVRRRLVEAAAHLRARLHSGATGDTADTLLAMLAEGSDDDVAMRCRWLDEAVADFDAATITTIHGFCSHVLQGVGVLGDVDRGAAFATDVRDLVTEVLDDLYVRRFYAERGELTVTYPQALAIARAVVANPDAAIRPDPVLPAGAGPAAPDDPAQVRARLARAVREEVERRKRRSGVLTYDDLLVRLRDTLVADELGLAATRLRSRYRVALVDEFQDTDPVQWEILERVFGRPPSTLVLIGDPKQAIYAFRGADVYAYLRAARAAGHRASLSTSYRSDQPLLDAIDVLFAGAELGHREIPYRTVSAAPQHRLPRLADAPVGAPLRVRVVPRDWSLVEPTPNGWVGAPSARGHIARDLAADVAALLSSPATITPRSRDGRDLPASRVGAGDIAVLVRTHREAHTVRDALADAGVPAVLAGVGTVFATPAARDWLRLLRALERPAATGRARLAALTPFLGWSAEEVATADEAAWNSVHIRLRRWADVLRWRGVAALLETVTAEQRLPGRLLALPDGERMLTDLRHVGELLHAGSAGERPGPVALATWLRQRIAEATADAEPDERTRRLDSDAAAVQVLTIYRGKGLEFPLVYCPYLWDAPWVGDDELAVYHDEDTGARCVDVAGMQGAESKGHRDAADRERLGEQLRLAYVAVTRARHQAVLWWAPSAGSDQSPLHRLLWCRDETGAVSSEIRRRPPPHDEALARLRDHAAAAPGCISVEVAGAVVPATWTPPPPPATPLEVARLARALDERWRRTSYSALVAHGRTHAPPAAAGAAHDPVERRGPGDVGSEPEDTPREDEALEPLALASPVAAAPGGEPGADGVGLRAVALPLARMPGGAEVGTFVHGVLEAVDFAAADLPAALRAAVADQQGRRHVDVGDPTVLVAGLAAALTTPLGPLAGDASLADIGRGDRLDELVFELPLAGGSAPRAAALRLDAVAALLRAHLPSGDPLAGYPDRLDALAAAPDAPDVRGYLTGSIDLVLRRDGRFVVVDYKTNWLGTAPDDEVTAWHYRPAALAVAMQAGHYPLQALLYAAALHRYLRWRLPGYDPDRHLGGVAYLFLRGMAGPATPRVGQHPCGVFSWAVPPALIAALSELLDRGVPDG
jgi:exodeoxyribonuclease V beta subunit